MTATRDDRGRGAPLAGILVVALEQAVAAPFASRQLGDLGARVIKVERPGGGDFARGYDETVHGESSYFVWLNGGKESVCLDLNRSEDRRMMDALLESADVFLQNLAPGAIDRLGFGMTDLRRRHPRLVTCSITGYGTHGPMAERKAYDLLVQCEAGLLSVTGTPDAEAKVGVSIVDIATGMYAHTGILAALIRRQQAGEGAHVEVAMLDAISEWMTQPYLYAAYSGRRPVRSGSRHASIAPYGPFRVGDGGRVFLAVQNDREWRRLCTDVLGDATLLDDPRFQSNADRSQHVEELTDLIEERIAGHTRGSLGAALEAAGIASAEVRSIEQLPSHPQLSARGRWRDVSTHRGPVRMLLPPTTIDGADASADAVPSLGEHDAAIRREFDREVPLEHVD